MGQPPVLGEPHHEAARVIAVRQPTKEDISEILKDIRFEDMAEWFAGTGQVMSTLVPAAVETSEMSRVAADEHGPLVMWGATAGRVWMFCTNRASRKAWSLHKVLRPSVDEMSSLYGDLHCVADVRNLSHLRWLVWLGFEELGDVDLPPFGLTFKVYVKD